MSRRKNDEQVKEEGPKFVEVTSLKTITITCGLQSQNLSNPDPYVKDGFKVKEKWSKYSIQINQGKFTYPAEILEWHSFKALEKAGVFTVGHKQDDTNDSKAIEQKKVLEELAEESDEKKEESLEEIAEK